MEGCDGEEVEVQCLEMGPRDCDRKKRMLKIREDEDEMVTSYALDEIKSKEVEYEYEHQLRR